MSELIQSINNVADVLGHNNLPKELSIIGMILPIILTVLIITFNIFIQSERRQKEFNKQKENLQKTIYNREVWLQSRDSILKNIYQLKSYSQ